MDGNVSALERAIDIAGGQSALAEKIGGKVKQGHVWWWLKESGRAPAEHCIAIENATDGKVTRYELRPDVFGPAPIAQSV